MQQHFAVALFDLENFHALVRFTPLPSREVEFVGVQRADDFAAARHAFGERALLVRTAVLRGEKMVVALAAAGGEFPGLAAWSNQSSGAVLTLAFAPHNHWSAPILSWTNEGHIPSNTPSFESVNTNRLLH